MAKIFPSPDIAIQDILHDNMSIMVGGFGICGIPEKLIGAIAKTTVKNLTIITITCGIDDFGVGLLISHNKVKKVIASYTGGNKVFEDNYLAGNIELELVPQGTLAESIRSAGAGIPAFYTRTGVGTIVAENKEVREFNGKKYLMEKALSADLALIKGWKADKSGNVIYNKTARNINPVMATAAKQVVCEVEQLVEIGDLDHNNIHTPNIFIDRLVLGQNYEKRIEFITNTPR